MDTHDHRKRARGKRPASGGPAQSGPATGSHAATYGGTTTMYDGGGAYCRDGNYYGSSWYGSTLRDAGLDARERLEPLIDRIRQLDELRLRLESAGGDLDTLQELALLLNTHFMMRTPSGFTSTCYLIKPAALRAFVREVTQYTARLEIRTLPHGIPVYHLCRTREDIYGEYGLVVEDIHISPGYPAEDERFVRLRSYGREEYWLRLSQFRSGVEVMLGTDDSYAVDSRLFAAGRWVLSAAWHESQRPAMLIARTLELPAFFRAVECLHLALTSDPCELRAHADATLLRFFTEVYDHPPIRAWLASLSARSGAQLDRIWRDALVLYRALSADFSQFLGTELAWGAARSRTPLWKIVFGNYHRMDSISRVLREDAAVRDASIVLERAAEAVTERLLSIDG